jgi:hypothetical protein
VQWLEPERSDNRRARPRQIYTGATRRAYVPLDRDRVVTAAKRFEARRDLRSGERYLAVYSRGRTLQDDPALNKGTCFTHDEREALGLTGLLPPAVQSFDEQLERAYGNYLKAGDPVRRYLFLVGLQDRNETLFYRLVLDHLDEMVPVIYTPTVGQACEHYSHIYRRAHGVYITPDERGRIGHVLRQATYGEPRVIVITDNEAILGIGDQGVGGMPIARQARVVPWAPVSIPRSVCLDLDVGTNNLARLIRWTRPPQAGRAVRHVELLDRINQSRGVSARARAVRRLRERQRIRGPRALRRRSCRSTTTSKALAPSSSRASERFAPDGRPTRKRAWSSARARPGRDRRSP